MQYIIALLSILLGAVAQFFLKIGVTAVQEKSKHSADILKNGISNPYLLTGLSCYGLSLLLWFFVLSKMELSKAYPMVSLGYIFTLILAYLFLNEAITVAKVVGITFILIGVIVLNR
ncbi:MAG: EamA family transporter [Pedobacter sp.]|nr:EamA family transporter [Pedobacter sp.]MDQ8053931.1 EamA family transporter [Pedobacter sp.]